MELQSVQNAVNPLNLVFCSEQQTPISNNGINKTLKKICQHLNIQTITCHVLRHTHGSVLLYHNLNIKYVSRRLGYKEIVTTLQIYSHVLDELEQTENRKVDAVMEELF